MKEELYTIPLMDAFRAEDECPFCYIERDVEQNALDFVLGRDASYMQDHVRAETDRIGFCRKHYEKMFNYSETLANALILETRIKYLMKEMKSEMKKCSVSGKISFKEKMLKDPSSVRDNNNVSRWVHEKEESCYICDHIKRNYDRYVATFFYLYKKKESEFIDLVKNGKGMCLHHLADILVAAPLYLNKKEEEELRNILFPQTISNMERVLEDVEWLQKKFDYRYKDAEWKNSRDAVQRAMQKITGGYPADPPYRPR
ncbi:MAG: hypothetical protein IJ274_04805 [Lachnospiraceae bacterium]|nr:hypothetical protein [Lachnospiraceae bacterium]